MTQKDQIMNQQVQHNLDMLAALVHSSIKSNDCIMLIAERIKIAQKHVRLYSRYNPAYGASIQQRLDQITSGKE